MSKGSYEYPISLKKNLASLVVLVFSSGCWSGDSPVLPLALTVPPTKASGTSLNLAVHPFVQQRL